MDRPPPTTTAIVIATAILAGVAGYFIGQGASIGIFSTARGSPLRSDAKRREPETEEEDEDEDENEGGEIAAFEGNTDEVKMVLVVRTDLGMGKGE